MQSAYYVPWATNSQQPRPPGSGRGMGCEQSVTQQEATKARSLTWQSRPAQEKAGRDTEHGRFAWARQGAGLSHVVSWATCTHPIRALAPAAARTEARRGAAKGACSAILLPSRPCYFPEAAVRPSSDGPGPGKVNMWLGPHPAATDATREGGKRCHCQP